MATKKTNTGKTKSKSVKKTNAEPKTVKKKKDTKKLTSKKTISVNAVREIGKAPKKSSPKKKTTPAGKKQTQIKVKKTRVKKASVKEKKKPESPVRKKQTVQTLSVSEQKPVIPPHKMAAFRLAQRIGVLMLEKKAENIMILDVGKLTGVMDYFVIGSGSADIHIKAITDHILDTLEKEGHKAHHVEGREMHRWVLIDYIDVVAHIFDHDTRAYYNLERLWGDAPSVPVKDDFEK